MKLIIRRESIIRSLSWARRVLFASAGLCLGYCAFAVADAWIYQRRGTKDLDRLLRDRRAAGEGIPRLESFTPEKDSPGTSTYGLIGRIEIPRLVFSAVVVEGIDHATLRRAIGHIRGTALPGQPGNVGLAGHRDTLFRPLKDVRIKDEIQFLTLDGDFKYVVESLAVVDPIEVGVLAPSSLNMLTLVTCYPFSYVGGAPKRFIVKARQEPKQPRAKSTLE